MNVRMPCSCSVPSRDCHWNEYRTSNKDLFLAPCRMSNNTSSRTSRLAFSPLLPPFSSLTDKMVLCVRATEESMVKSQSIVRAIRIAKRIVIRGDVLKAPVVSGVHSALSNVSHHWFSIVKIQPSRLDQNGVLKLLLSKLSSNFLLKVRVRQHGDGGCCSKLCGGGGRLRVCEGSRPFLDCKGSGL